jgi:hypothetical protein
LTIICVAAASAQGVVNTQKRAVIGELIEVSGMQRSIVAAFRESVTRYQQNWASAVIVDFKAKGLFKSLTPQDAASMEKLIRELGDNIFNEVKRRVELEVATTEKLVALSEQTYDKYYTLEELNELVAFYKTPTGRKFSEESLKALRAALLSHQEAKGIFNVLPSAEAEEAKVDRLLEDLEHKPQEHAQQIVAAVKLPPLDHFTEDERRELTVFFQTPVGKKLNAIASSFMAEVLANNVKLLGPSIEKLTGEIIDAQMKIFQERAYQILKNYDRQGRRKHP